MLIHKENWSSEASERGISRHPRTEEIHASAKENNTLKLPSRRKSNQPTCTNYTLADVINSIGRRSK